MDAATNDPVEQVAVLSSLIESAKSYDINGVRVVISSLVIPHFVPDLANLAHKIRDMEGLDVLFLVVQIGDKTHVIARSRIPQVNAGLALEELGGGGHATAASAVVRDMTYLQTRERLIDVLMRHIKPGPVASEIMTSPVKTIPSGSTIAEAGEAMTRFSVNVLPVMRDGNFEGIITREVVQKALFHGLGEQNVGEFMTTGGAIAGPDMKPLLTMREQLTLVLAIGINTARRVGRASRPGSRRSARAGPRLRL